MLIPRFSATYLNAGQVKKLQKLGLTAIDLTQDEITLRKILVKPQDDLMLPDLEETYSSVVQWAQQTDPTLVPAAKAEFNKMTKMVESLVKRIQKAAELKEEQKLKQLSQLWEKLFPNEGLQERSESWLTFLVADPEWLNKIYNSISPLDFRFHVLEDV